MLSSADVDVGIKGGTASSFLPPIFPIGIGTEGLLLDILDLIADAGGGPVGIIPNASLPAAIAAKLVEVTGLVLAVITGPV